MTGYVNVLTLTLPVTNVDGIAASQSVSGAGNLTLNGTLVTAGVANLGTPQLVGITSAGNDTGITFTIVGTDRYGMPQTDSFAGSNTALAQSNKNFLTVTKISTSGSTASTVQAGINEGGATAPIIIDRFVNPANYSAAMVFTGTATASLQISYDDLSPAWDLANNAPTWFTASGFAALTANQNGIISGPITMLRLLVTSGTGSVTATVITPYIAGV
jgi:hypothetical protein